MGRGSGRDQAAIRTWPCACARMCRAYIRQLAHMIDCNANDDEVMMY